MCTRRTVCADGDIPARGERTLSEIGGREMVGLDHWMRLIGVARIRELLASPYHR